MAKRRKRQSSGRERDGNTAGGGGSDVIGRHRTNTNLESSMRASTQQTLSDMASKGQLVSREEMIARRSSGGVSVSGGNGVGGVGVEVKEAELPPAYEHPDARAAVKLTSDAAKGGKKGKGKKGGSKEAGGDIEMTDKPFSKGGVGSSDALSVVDVNLEVSFDTEMPLPTSASSAVVPIADPLDQQPPIQAARTAKARYDYDPQQHDELRLVAGDMLTIIPEEAGSAASEWFTARNGSGEQGLVPSNYVEILPEAAPATTQRRRPPGARPDNSKRGVRGYPLPPGKRGGGGGEGCGGGSGSSGGVVAASSSSLDDRIREVLQKAEADQSPTNHANPFAPNPFVQRDSALN